MITNNLINNAVDPIKQSNPTKSELLLALRAQHIPLDTRVVRASNLVSRRHIRETASNIIRGREYMTAYAGYNRDEQLAVAFVVREYHAIAIQKLTTESRPQSKINQRTAEFFLSIDVGFSFLALRNYGPSLGNVDLSVYTKNKTFMQVFMRVKAHMSAANSAN